MTHKGTVDLQKVERKKRLKRRAERREQAIALQRGMNTRVTEQERNLPESGHDRQEEGVDEEASPMEEELWIEHREALQIRITQIVSPQSSINSNQSARV